MGEESSPEQDDKLRDRSNQNTNDDPTATDGSSRPQTTKSKGSQAHEDSKDQPKRVRPHAYNFSPSTLKRDPTMDAIIESRKLNVIENIYTRLSQTTSQARRPSPHVQINPVKPRSKTAQTEGVSHTDDGKEQIMKSQHIKSLSSTSTLELDNDKWDDGLNSEFDKGLFRI